MKILHVDTERGFRGGEQQVLWLMNGLRGHGIDQALLARAGNDLAARASELGHRVFETAASSRFSPMETSRLRSLVERGGFDLIHAHTGNAHALALRISHGRPVVVTRRVDFGIRKNPLSRRKYRAPNVHLIAISRGVREVLVQGGVPPGRIEIVPSGVDPKRFAGAQGRDEWRRRWGVREPGPVVGVVGSYVDHKDPLNLIRATPYLVESLPGVRVVFVGEGELRPAMEAEARRLGLSGNVILTGWQQEVGDCLAAMDLFVMPSKLEGLCTSLLDAMAAGLPCVATTAGGIPDIVQDGRTGLLVPPGDPKALADAIKRLWSDAPLRKELRDRGPRHVAENFSVEKMVEGTLNCYHKILTQSAAEPPGEGSGDG